MGTSIYCMIEDSQVVRGKAWKWRKPPAVTQRSCIFCDCDEKRCKWCGGSGIRRFWSPPGNYIAYRVLLAGGARGYRDQAEVPIEPNSVGRGCPRGSDPVTKQVMSNLDTVTWTSLRELVEYDWGSTIDCEVSLWLRDVDAIASPSHWVAHRDDAYESWRHVHPRSAPDGGIGFSGQPHLTMAEADTVLKNKEMLVGPRVHGARVHARWTETLAVACRDFREFFDQFIDEETRHLLPVARDAREEGNLPRYRQMTSQLDDVRFVFGFL